MGRGHPLLGLQPPQSSTQARLGGPGAKRGSTEPGAPADPRLLSLTALESPGKPGKLQSGRGQFPGA